MTENELNVTVNCIKAMAQTPNSDELIKHLLKNLYPTNTDNNTKREAITQKKHPGKYFRQDGTFWIFTKKEIEKMPQKYRKSFIAAEQRVFYRIKMSGVYEARYKRKAEGIKIEVSALTLEALKEKFIQALRDCITGTKTTKRKKTPENTLFMSFVYEWLEEKRRSTKEGTYKEYERQIEKDIAPYFQNLYVSQVDRTTLQNFLNIYIDSKRMRTAQKLQLILRCACDLISCDFNVRSPMEKVNIPFYKPKKGSAFTTVEEALLVDYCIKNQSLATTSALLVLLFFGLRQSELASLNIVDGQWLECTTSKSRLGHDEEIRRIPFTPIMKRYIQYIDFEKAKNTNLTAVKSTIRRLFPNHHPHELRYTFITRCKQCGVNPELVMLWDGHEMDNDVKTSKVDRGYTDYPIDYQLEEAKKVNYDIPTTLA